jgi:hypothetical protein
MKVNRTERLAQDNNSEVAAELGITEQGAWDLKKRALIKAKALLEKRGYKATDFFAESKDE